MFLMKKVSKKQQKKLNLSQPTISEHIKNMEFILEKKLFIKSKNNLKPTDYAKSIYPTAFELVEKFDYATSFILKSASPKTSTIKISCSTLPASLFIPDILKNFTVKFNQNINVFVSNSDKVAEDIKNFTSLLGFCGSAVKDENLEYILLAQDELIVLAKQNFFNEDTITLDYIKKYPMILRTHGSGTRKEFEKFLKTNNTKIDEFNTPIVTNDLNTLQRLVVSGAGYSVISNLLAQKLNRTADTPLKIFSIANSTILRNIYAVYNKRISLGKEYLRLIDAAKDILKKD